MDEHLDTYCKGCDQFSAPHRRRDDGQWVCEDCGHLVKCSDPQWSDNCGGDLTTPHEVKKGLCEGCMAVIDSWGDDGEEDDAPEQTKLVTDGGQIEDPYAGWVCDGCGKHVTGSMPVDQCSDCGGRWFEATPERLGCDLCSDEDASRVFNSEHNRLCDSCIAEENISMYGDRLADAAKVMRGEADELAARDDVDDHLNDVIEGLWHHAEEIEEFLQEEYYR